VDYLLLLLSKKIRLEITTLVEVYTAIGDGLNKKRGWSDPLQEVLATSHPWHPMCSSMSSSVVHYKNNS